MKEVSYSIWIKDSSDFLIHNDIMLAFIQVMSENPKIERYDFRNYPPKISEKVLNLINDINNLGFDLTDDSYFSVVEMKNNNHVFVATIMLPKYENSYVRLISSFGMMMAKYFEFIGTQFTILDITVKSPNNIYIAGEGPLLQNWSVFDPIPLSFRGGKGGPFWNIQIPLINGEKIEFKFVTAKGEFEDGPNRIVIGTDHDQKISATFPN